MSKFLKILLFSTVILTSGLISGQAMAQQDNDIYTDPLFVDDQIFYQPIPAANIEAEKIRALKEKDSEVMYVIGMMYRDGKNVEPDIVQAQEWFKNAAEAGHSDSMVELARIYSLDKEFTGMDKNRNEASRWIKEAERRNNPKAFYTMGTMYEDGFPFDRSYEQSVEYYKKAAYRGILNAYVKLYIAYQYGKGVDPDLKKAIYWLRKTFYEAQEGSKVKDYAKQMLADAYFEVGLNETDPALKFKLFNLAWANGNRYAIEAIGDMFQAGVGVKQNFQSAAVAYETAIKNFESVYAMERLGFVYLKGPGEISRDYKKAFDLFTKAADLGGVTASYELGYMYYYGLGIAKDPKLAQKWFDRSKELSKRRREPNFVASAYDRSTDTLKTILSDASVKEAEKERQKTVNQSITDGNTTGLPGQIKDAPRVYAPGVNSGK